MWKTGSKWNSRHSHTCPTRVSSPTWSKGILFGATQHVNKTRKSHVVCNSRVRTVVFDSKANCRAACLWFLTDRNKTVKQCPCSLQPVKLSVVSSDATGMEGQKALCCWQFMGFSLSVERTVRLDNRALNGKARCYYATEQPNNICQVKWLTPLHLIPKFEPKVLFGLCAFLQGIQERLFLIKGTN